jgi:hypothetical protein
MARYEFPREYIVCHYGDSVLITTDDDSLIPADVQYLDGTQIIDGVYIVPTNSTLEFLGPNGVTSGLYAHVVGATTARQVTAVVNSGATGPQGEPGPAGPDGAAGPQGEPGDAGTVPDGSITGGTAGTGVQIAALTITDANIATDAAIAESKLNLANDAAASTASRRTLGTTEFSAAAGDDARFLAVGTTTGTVAAGDDGRFLAVGTTTGTVAAGDDGRFLEVGTTTGTVAAGDDLRFLEVGTITGTVAAGDDSRFKAVGTTTGTVAAGDDSRFLEVGTTTGTVAAGDDARFLVVGTTTGTVAAGDDSRFKSVGTTTGTVAAGDDARFGAATLTACGVTPAMVTGTITVTTALAKTTSVILLTLASKGTVTLPQPLYVSAISDGVSFTILSADASDTSTVSWAIFEPPPVA